MAKLILNISGYVKVSLGLGLMISLIISCQPQTRKMDLNTSVNYDFGHNDPELDMTKTCDTKVETANVSKEVIDNTVVIEDEIASKDIENLNCQGHVVWKGHGPEKLLKKVVEVMSPITEDSTKVNFIQIENTRTCTTQRISPADDKSFDEKEVTLENGTKVPVQAYKTIANSKGTLKLLLTDNPYRMDANSLNVHDGGNHIKIQYFGKCIKKIEHVDDKQTDAYNCETAELIKTKEIFVNIKVKRPESGGVSQNLLCADSKK